MTEPGGKRKGLTDDQRRRLASIARSAVVDGSILAGGALVTWGAHLVYRPAGFLVAGALLLALGWKGARG